MYASIGGCVDTVHSHLTARHSNKYQSSRAGSLELVFVDAQHRELVFQVI